MTIYQANAVALSGTLSHQLPKSNQTKGNLSPKSTRYEKPHWPDLDQPNESPRNKQDSFGSPNSARLPPVNHLYGLNFQLGLKPVVPKLKLPVESPMMSSKGFSTRLGDRKSDIIYHVHTPSQELAALGQKLGETCTTLCW